VSKEGKESGIRVWDKKTHDLHRAMKSTAQTMENVAELPEEKQAD